MYVWVKNINKECNKFIDNCKYCEIVSNNVICKECSDGYLTEKKNEIITRCKNLCEYETLADILIENDPCKSILY